MRDKNRFQIHAGDLIQIDGEFRWFRHTPNGTVSWVDKVQEPLIGLFVSEKITKPFEIDVATNAAYLIGGAKYPIFECQILANGRRLNVVAARKEITLIACASHQDLQKLSENNH